MFTYCKTREVIKSLNQIFVSEAHLQLAFAMQAETLYHDEFDFFPEFPVYDRVNVKERDEFDLLIRDKDDQSETLIEFKYKTKNTKSNPQKWKLESKVEVALANHAAQNNGCYDCWSDIGRIEKNVKDGVVQNGFFIFITNDSLYWLGSERKNNYTELSMKEGDHEAKKRGFTVPSGKSGKRTAPLDIKNDYSFQYEDYYTTPGVDDDLGVFKFLIVEIK